MKLTNRTTPPKRKDIPMEPKPATPETEPPSDSAEIASATPQAPSRVTEVSKPVVEVIACFANCAGFPETLITEYYEEEAIEYIFDLRDNRTGAIYKTLFARKEDDTWDLPFLQVYNMDSGLPLLSELGTIYKTPKDNYADIADYRDIIEAELNRWCRNLYALVDVESVRDEGFDEYLTTLTEMVKERDQSIEKPGHNDTGWYSKFERFPLRP